VTTTLQGVWGHGSTDVWVGTTDSAGGNLLHWNGTSWTLASTGWPSDLDAVWVSGPGDVWAAGTPIGGSTGAIFHHP
jgi:hypothetical protein